MIINSIAITNFGCFIGNRIFEINPPGLYYVRGINRVEPELGSNGAGKTTLFNALYWAWTGRTLTNRRPGAAIEPWGSKGSTIVTVNFGKHLLRRSRNPNELIIDGRQVDQAEVDNYLGMSADNLSRTLIIGQQAEHFLDLTAEQQSQMFTDMLDLDVWIRAAKVSAKRAQEAASKEQLEIARAAERKGAIDALKDRLKHEKKALTEFGGILRQQLEVFEKRIYEWEDRIADSDDTKPKIVKTKLVEFRKSQLEVSEKFKVADRLEQDQRNQLRDFQQRAKAAEKMIQKYEDDIDREDQDDIRCPECDQVISSEKAEDRLKHYQNAEEKIIKLIAKTNEVLLKYSTEVHSLSIELASWATKVNDENLKEQKSSIELRNWKHNKELLLEGYEQAKVDLKRLADSKNPHKLAIEQIEDDVEKNQEEYDALRKSADRLHWRAETCRFWTDAFREIRLNLIDDTTLEIEVAANRHATLLGLLDWDIKFATEKVSKSDHVSRAFTATISPPGQPPVRWQSYSGGESQRWRWAVTFALSEVLLGRAGISFNIEVLDEPTAHLSQAGIDSLIDMLRDRAIDLKRAIYFIDHRNLDRGEFDGVIEIERTKKGSNINL